MGNKDRDLAQLAQFQMDSLGFCQQISQIGATLLENANEASVSLQDDVSKKTLHRIESVAEKLTKIGNYGQQEMLTALHKTRGELDRWNNL